MAGELGGEKVVVIFANDFALGLKAETFEEAVVCGDDSRCGILCKKCDSRQFCEKSLEAAVRIDGFKEGCAGVWHGDELWGLRDAESSLEWLR